VSLNCLQVQEQKQVESFQSSSSFRLSGFCRVREEKKKDFFLAEKMFSSGQNNEKCVCDTVFSKILITVLL